MSDKSRRKLLKSIAAGSGAIVAGKNLPESWSRPVVNSVMLPAHAQTSGPFSYHYTEDLEIEFAQLELDSKNQLFASIIDELLPLANAGGGGGPVNNAKVDVCIDHGYEDKPDKWRAAVRIISLVNSGPYQTGDLIAMYLAEGGTVGGPAIPMMTRTCCGAPNPPTSMKVYTADGIEADFALSQEGMDGPFERTAPIGVCPFGDPDNETCSPCNEF